MDRKRAKELQEAFDHFADGGEVQSRLKNDCRCDWEEDNDPKWWESHEYRIKPEPDEFWVNIYPDIIFDSISKGKCGFLFRSRESAEKTANFSALRIAVHVREVVEEDK